MNTKKKNKFLIYIPILSGVFLIGLNSCNNNDNNPVTTVTTPALTTAAVTKITLTTASCGGNKTSDGGAGVAARGVVYSTSENPSLEENNGFTRDGTGTGTFVSNLLGLTPEETYYVRAYATNSAGTGYGSGMSFTTHQEIAGCIDGDGNIYNTVTIGTQEWMAENLKTTKYNDGSVIPNVTNNTTWGALTTPGYCWYNNDFNTFGTVYGALYNWYALDPAINGGKSICPTGWHVPADEEWITLTNFLGGESVAGGKLKEAGTTHWVSPNAGATNENGFTALPGGIRRFDPPLCCHT